jgi:hypothetical protein
MVGQVNQEQEAGGRKQEQEALTRYLHLPPAPAACLLPLVDRIKLSLPMFAFDFVQQHAPAGKKFFNARGPVFTIAAGH